MKNIENKIMNYELWIMNYELWNLVPLHACHFLVTSTQVLLNWFVIVMHQWIAMWQVVRFWTKLVYTPSSKLVDRLGCLSTIWNAQHDFLCDDVKYQQSDRDSMKEWIWIKESFQFFWNRYGQRQKNYITFI